MGGGGKIMAGHDWSRMDVGVCGKSHNLVMRIENLVHLGILRHI